MSGEVLFQDHGPVRWITLNRPQAANAIDTAMADGLAAALSLAAEDRGVRAVVLTGAGDRVFCAGVDIRDGADAAQRRRNLRTCFWAVLDFPKPLVAAVNGVASGGGCMLALLADQRVTAEGASYVLPEINLGIPSYPALAILNERVGGALAADLVLTGRGLSAAEAGVWGLTVTSAPSELAAIANLVTGGLASKPAETYRKCKAWISRRMRSAIEDAATTGAELEKCTPAAHG